MDQNNNNNNNNNNDKQNPEEKKDKNLQKNEEEIAGQQPPAINQETENVPIEMGSPTIPSKSPSSRRKKRDDDAGGSGSGKKRVVNLQTPKHVIPCRVCEKQFESWRALFGHMRCHPIEQRPDKSRGAYAAPQWTPPESPVTDTTTTDAAEALPAALLQAAEEALAQLTDVETASTAVLSMDLNNQTEREKSEADASSAGAAKEKKKIDLNKSPPPSSSDGSDSR